MTIGSDDLDRIEAGWALNEPTENEVALVAELRDAWAERDRWEQAAIDAANEVEARWNGLDRQALIRERDEARAQRDAAMHEMEQALLALARIEAACDDLDNSGDTGGRWVRAAIKGGAS